MNFLQQRRQQLGLRAADIAVRANMSERRIYDLEHSPKNIRSLSLENAYAVAGAYRMPVSDIYALSKEENNHENSTQK